jgi:hypothetical protein
MASQLFASEVTLFFADAEPIRLELKGRVEGGLPTSINFGNVLRGRNATQRFRLKSKGQSTPVIYDLQFDKRYHEVQIKPAAENVRDAIVAVVLKPDAPYGDFETKLQFRIREQPESIKQITINGRVIAPVEARSHTIAMLSGPDKSIEASAIELYSPYGRKLDYKACEAFPAGFLSFEPVKSSKDGLSVAIPIKATGQFGAGLTSGTLRATASVDGTDYVETIKWHVWVEK